MCGASDAVCEDHQMDMALNLNVTQHAQGVSLAPTLLSDHDVTVSFRLLVRSKGAGGSSTQSQRRTLSLAAGQMRDAGNATLSLRCPYQVEITAEVWQNGQRLLQKSESLTCPV